MKVHIGVDADTGVVHSLATTPANVHDVTEAHRFLHGSFAGMGGCRVLGVEGEPGVGVGLAGGWPGRRGNWIRGVMLP